MTKLRDAGLRISGRTQLWRVFTGRRFRPVTPAQPDWRPNQIQYSAGFVAAQCIGFGDKKFRINGMYIEYENLADPEDPVVVPTYTKADGIEYYEDLQSSGTRDFLRVPLVQLPLLGVVTGFEDYFQEGQGNSLTFFALTQGSTGVHGKTFSDSVNSKVCGVALVATPVFGDRTQDVIFARTYYDPSDQILKEPAHQIGVTWEIQFKFD